MLRIFKRNKGFSLIELLIVIAILGVLSAIAFSMFSGVVHSSRKKADDQQAGIIEKAVIAYMLETQDCKLEHVKYGSLLAEQSMNSKDYFELVYALQHTISCTIDGKTIEIEPLLNPKHGASPSSSDFVPLWSPSKGGQYVGYKIEVFSEKLNCNVTPVKNQDDAKVFVK